MIDGNLPMFKDFKKKTEELKKLAEEKAKYFRIKKQGQEQ